LATAAPEDSAQMVAALSKEGIGATVIGKVVAGPPVVQMETDEGLVPMPVFEQDELTRLFAD
jgi:hydrogenase maturation factor